MDTKKCQRLIIIGFLLVLESCDHFCPISSGTTISLMGGYSIYSPVNDSIKVGDTLLLYIIVPTKLNYDNGNSSIDFSKASNVGTDVHFTLLKGIQISEGALDSFKLVKQKGNYLINSLLPATSISVTFDEKDGNYSFLMGCVALKKGIYSIAILDIPYAHKNCDYATISIVSRSSDSHLHYLKDIYYGGGAIFPTDSTHSYCFKVY